MDHLRQPPLLRPLHLPPHPWRLRRLPHPWVRLPHRRRRLPHPWVRRLRPYRRARRPHLPANPGLRQLRPHRGLAYTNATRNYSSNPRLHECLEPGLRGPRPLSNDRGGRSQDFGPADSPSPRHSPRVRGRLERVVCGPARPPSPGASLPYDRERPPTVRHVIRR